MSCKRLVTLDLALGGWLVIAIPAAYGAAPVCDGTAYRAFDFWIGTWQVTLPDGRSAGRNVIESAEDGCLLVERWLGRDGSTGTSLNVYDPAAGQWRQFWVSPGTDACGNSSSRATPTVAGRRGSMASTLERQTDVQRSSAAGSTSVDAFAFIPG